MKKTLSGYSLMVALLLGVVSAPLAAQNASENKVVAALTKLDSPVLLFKTTAKDPYFMFHRPGSTTLEVVTFGYYSGKGAHVQRVTKPRQQLCSLMPIRMTKSFGDAPVKIDEKYVGWRESVIAKTYEDIFKAVGIMPDPYYKGTPFVDQYLETVPMKWVFNNAAEFASFRLFIQPLFESHNLLAKGLPKPVLVVEFEGPQVDQLSASDYEFLETYFTLVDLTDDTVKLFFADHQKQILEAVINSKDAKPVKEAFVDIMFRQMESVTNEFKTKEMAAAVVAAVVSAITMEVMKEYVKDITKHAKDHAHKKIVKPMVVKVIGEKEEGGKKPTIMVDGVKYAPEADAAQKSGAAPMNIEAPAHNVRNGALLAAGILGAGVLLTAGACAATAE